MDTFYTVCFFAFFSFVFFGVFRKSSFHSPVAVSDFGMTVAVLIWLMIFFGTLGTYLMVEATS